MKRIPSLFASLLACAGLSAQTTIVFKDATDFGTNLTTSGITTSSAIAIVDGGSSPASALTGEAIRISDTGADRPQLRYQTTSPLDNGIVLQFDGKFVSGNSNIIFRLGPSAASVATLSTSIIGLQFTASGSVVAEQGQTVGSGTNVNVTYSSAFGVANPFSIAIYYNKSASTLDFTAQGGPSSLDANTWALYVDGVQKGTGLAERYALDVSGGFGMAWISGTSGASTMDFQLDNIQITTIPEPATLAALLGAAPLGLFFLRRRSSRR